MFDLDDHGLVASATPPRDIGGPRSVARVIDGARAAEPDRVLLVGRHDRHTAAELDELSTRVAAMLHQLGVRPGARVAAALPNDDAIVVAFLGAMKAGAIWVGLNRALAAPEKAYMLRDAQVSVLLADPETADQLVEERRGLPDLDRVVVVAPDDDDRDDWTQLLRSAPVVELADVEPGWPAAIAYTSGTTGFPKGAVHTHHNLLLPGKVGRRRLVPPDPARRPVMGVALPLTILNLMVLGPIAAYQSGTPVVAMDRIDAVGMAEWIERERITTFAAVPAMVHDLLTHPDVTDEMLGSIDSIGVGGADMPEAFRRIYEERFGRRVGTGYGLTEAPTSVTMEDVAQPPVPGTCGRALPHIRIQILDRAGAELPPGEHGEVCIGPALEGDLADVYRPMLGYWNRPTESREALRGGVLHTNDVGYLDDDGNLFIKDRRNDLIVRGGANVYPAEVERVLHDEPAVAACAVIGRPDERLGERVVAFVEVVPGAELDPEALLERCRANLARYKVPESITVVDRFDRTPMGKIRKTVLRERVADQG